MSQTNQPLSYTVNSSFFLGLSNPKPGFSYHVGKGKYIMRNIVAYLNVLFSYLILVGTYLVPTLQEKLKKLLNLLFKTSLT